jgi:hypothetical protein
LRLLGAGAVYMLAWLAAVGVLAATRPQVVPDAVAVLVIFGVVFSAIGWLTTLGRRPAAIPVRRPWLEAALVLAYLLIYAVLFTGYGLNAFHAAFPAGRGEAALLVVFKLAVHVILPGILLVAAGARLRPLFAAKPAGWPFWLSLPVLGTLILALTAVISPSVKLIPRCAWPPEPWPSPARAPSSGAPSRRVCVRSSCFARCCRPGWRRS